MSESRRQSNAAIKVLVAEDSPTQREEIVFLLEGQGFAVIAAKDGMEALKLASREKPDLIVSDVVMPKMTGFDLCRAIRKDPTLKRTPFVIVTSLSSPTDVFLGLECGADNFITKPYDVKTLLARIDYILTNRELRKSGKLEVGVEIEIAGERHFINAERQQILDLLVSTYEQAVRLNEEVQAGQKLLTRSYDTLDTLYRVAEGLNACQTEKDVAEHVLERSMELPGVEAGWIMLTDGGGRITFAGSRNLPNGMRPRTDRDGSCRCVQAILNGDLKAAENIEHCEWLAMSGNAAGIRCHASIPLIAETRPVGLLNLAGPGGGQFSEADLQTLSTIGQQVAIALARIRLYRDLENRVETRTFELQREVVDRQRAESVARLAELRLRDAIESLTEGFTLYDADDRLVMVNRRMKELFPGISDQFQPGTPFETIVRVGIDRGFYPEAKGREEDFFAERVKAHREAKGKAFDLQIEGGRWTLVCEQKTEDGGIVGSRTDITGLKRAEAALATRARQQTALAALGQWALSGPDLSVLLEESIGILTKTLDVPFAKVFERLSDGNGTMVLRAGAGWKDGYVGKSTISPGTSSQGGYTIEYGNPVVVTDWSSEARFTTPKLVSDHKIRCSVTVPIQGAGSMFGVLGIDSITPRDFSEDDVRFLESVANVIAVAVQRKDRDEGIRQANELIGGILDSSPVAIVTLDRDRRVASWNKAAEKMFGHTTEEIVGQPSPIVPEGREKEYGRYFGIIKGGDYLRDVETECRRKDGRLLHVKIAGAPLFDGGGNFRGGTFTIEDVTERRTMEEQLRQAQKMEAVGNLTGGIAHDFNNMLTVVMGNLDLLKMNLAGNPKALDFIGTAMEGAVRCAELTRQLLAFARKQDLSPRMTDVNSLLTGMGKLLDRALGETIDIVLKLEEAAWPVFIDQAQLDSAVMNLAVNARDAMPKGGILTLSTRNTSEEEIAWNTKTDVVPGDYVVLEVTDNGTGIPPEKINRIFEPFFTTKGIGKGTGLGLSMVYGFIKQSGGHVTVYSEVGHGTTFRLYLPRTKSDAVQAKDVPAPSKEGVRSKGEAILVVEDNPAVRKMVVQQLSTLGYRVTEASSGPDALRVLEKNTNVNLVFSDVVMPGGMTGRKLAKIIGERWPGVKILLTSGYSEASSQNGMASPVEILSKPYRQIDLAIRIRKLLDL